MNDDDYRKCEICEQPIKPWQEFYEDTPNQHAYCNKKED